MAPGDVGLERQPRCMPSSLKDIENSSWAIYWRAPLFGLSLIDERQKGSSARGVLKTVPAASGFFCDDQPGVLRTLRMQSEYVQSSDEAGRPQSLSIARASMELTENARALSDQEVHPGCGRMYRKFEMLSRPPHTRCGAAGVPRAPILSKRAENLEWRSTRVFATPWRVRAHIIFTCSMVGRRFSSCVLSTLLLYILISVHIVGFAPAKF